MTKSKASAASAVAKSGSADTPAPLVDPEQTLKASKALLAHIRQAKESQAATNKNLLADPDAAPAAGVPVWLTLTAKRHLHDSRRLQPARVRIPHSLNASDDDDDDDDSPSICLITADPQRVYKNAVAAPEFPESLRRRVTRVVDLAHLKSKFRAFEAQRKLHAEHDVFLADDRIVNQLPKALGKSFYKTTAKRPIPVVLASPRPKVDGRRVAAKKAGDKAGDKKTGEKDVNCRPPAEIAAEIEAALAAALVHLSPSNNTAVKVGYAHWPAERVAANADAVAAALVDRFVPRGRSAVRSLFLKGPETVALPLWQTDELWVDESHVVADGAADTKTIDGAEKANIGKKRKSADSRQEETDKKSRPAKKVKKPESNDDQLDEEIAARKAKLKKQKKAAKKAME